MPQPICPYCHEELEDNGENDFYESYYCCNCKKLINIYDMPDTEPCEATT